MFVVGVLRDNGEEANFLASALAIVAGRLVATIENSLADFDLSSVLAIALVVDENRPVIGVHSHEAA
ncbi:hypothetical protein [Rhizobium sp. AN80A]|uniref:hypothetical protein n=1 Tax=Rhizobium sp. AN80A TaxID=3040673 RepID=UPI0024B37BE7|nr:hypothetical protein [Rhizobium sp. AN80A]